MAAPPVYLDECVHHELVGALRQRGFTATSALDEGMLQLDDESQFAFATARAWVLLTYDYRDFLRLHHEFRRRGQAHGGILILPAPSRVRAAPASRRHDARLAWHTCRLSFAPPPLRRASAVADRRVSSAGLH